MRTSTSTSSVSARTPAMQDDRPRSRSKAAVCCSTHRCACFGVTGSRGCVTTPCDRPSTSIAPTSLLRVNFRCLTYRRSRKSISTCGRRVLVQSCYSTPAAIRSTHVRENSFVFRQVSMAARSVGDGLTKRIRPSTTSITACRRVRSLRRTSLAVTRRVQFPFTISASSARAKTFAATRWANTSIA